MDYYEGMISSVGRAQIKLSEDVGSSLTSFLFSFRENYTVYYERKVTKMNPIIKKAAGPALTVLGLVVQGVQTYLEKKALEEQVKKIAEKAVTEVLKNK